MKHLKADAREILARHLYLDKYGTPYAAREWDFGGTAHVNKEPWLRQADGILDLVTEVQ